MNRPLVVFGEDWGSHPSSTQHVVRHLADNHDVLWINSMGLRRPRFSLRDAKRLWQKITRPRLASSASPGHAPFNVMEPYNLPLPGHPLARWSNSHLLAQRIRRQCSKLRLSRPILWTSLPTAVDLVSRLNEHAVVYYCGDDFSALDGVDHAPVAKLERELAERADLIVAASDVLASRFDPAKTQVLHHGVDLTLFRRRAPRPDDLPADKPAAGFYGSIANWVDVHLIADIARIAPHWQFCLIGEVKTDISPLKSLPNVRFLGPKPHHQLPAYLQHWQAAILPFVDNAQIQACNPLKLREYLASGTPVITTPFPAMRQYASLIQVASTPIQWLAALNVCAQDNPAARLARQYSVRSDSWQARSQQVQAWLNQLG
ncbi:glycosyltransferase [Bowmanella sp. JS7-9]|uniref:Glycosyltransferase n=1 Tax=Pseudobowmanella zhangzhouensis TaxID=1537679 RepID=A0ABW1XJI3_9ALTE|nr:glycosyltransferase [Bowmanella sp. JS7-9]TBX24677.1 hypothetical protein TK45_04430 [Bowmanella sp. JS7-9]